ncbi:MAG: hypothetical protein DMG29_05965 [Acidobacteria bacterium]|nr:MAG: hypothetical protein DMG29_05965 [Acidobacteriota bacterium]
MIMARRLLPSVAILLLLAALACKKTVGENEAIRVAVQKHLAARGTLDLSAMEIDVKQVDIDRDHAIARKSNSAPSKVEAACKWLTRWTAKETAGRSALEPPQPETLVIPPPARPHCLRLRLRAQQLLRHLRWETFPPATLHSPRRATPRRPRKSSDQ